MQASCLSVIMGLNKLVSEAGQSVALCQALDLSRRCIAFCQKEQVPNPASGRIRLTYYMQLTKFDRSPPGSQTDMLYMPRLLLLC
ncbi:hypothetical protein PAXRUDRAFT_675813 [Paxillus rubicundulus Ve08.2h10]|uniref:Unplaced genomic scaffold scaffold_681, whole genome shotgun sequence n=1 Tax=Paxillus rubicundulus Ve08.2h10 TaxID=930991 RepID=A0A0D0E1P4_9AGAM|nr:hypothetical protein PAXRUDRAFT_675813 [Paxillus rubicundulus Ve08.2h10]